MDADYASNTRTATTPGSPARRRAADRSHVNTRSVKVWSSATESTNSTWLQPAALPSAHWQTGVSQGYVIGSVQPMYPEEMTSPAADDASRAEAVFLANLPLVDRL